MIVNGEKILKALFVFIFTLLLSYFAWDMSVRVRSSFVSQGYSIAINKLITAAENPQCQPFPVRFGERNIQLINVNCLAQNQEQVQGGGGVIGPEIQE